MPISFTATFINLKEGSSSMWHVLSLCPQKVFELKLALWGDTSMYVLSSQQTFELAAVKICDGKEEGKLI